MAGCGPIPASDGQPGQALLLLVDGHSWPSAASTSPKGARGLSTQDGVPTSVTYGFLKALLDNCKSLKPQGVVIAFDTAEPTFGTKPMRPKPTAM